MEKISEGISENIEDGCNIRKPPRLDSLSSCFLQFLAKLKIIINIIVIIFSKMSGVKRKSKIY